MPVSTDQTQYSSIEEKDTKVYKIKDLVPGDYATLDAIALDGILYLKLATHGQFNLVGKMVHVKLVHAKYPALYSNVNDTFYVEKEFCESHKRMYNSVIGVDSYVEECKYDDLRISMFKLTLRDKL